MGLTDLRCLPRMLGWTSIDHLDVQPAGTDVFVYANVVGSRVREATRATLRFADGGTVSTAPRGGLVLFALPDRYLTRERQRAFMTLETNAGPLRGGRAVYFRASR